MTLRDKIIKALTGSSGQNPVMLDSLRKIAEPICDDMQQLYDLLDQLYAARTVNRASGFKNSKQYVAYWETGAPPPAITFRITQPAPPQRVHRLEPAAKAAAPQPTPPQETTMASPQGITPAMIEIVTANPGIKIDALHAAVEKKVPGVTLKQVMDISYVTKAIKRIGRGKDAEMHPADSAPPQASTAQVKVKPQPAKNPAPKKAAAIPAPVAAAHPAAFDPEYSFAFGVRKDGGVAICKDGISVVLARSEVQTILAHTTQE